MFDELQQKFQGCLYIVIGCVLTLAAVIMPQLAGKILRKGVQEGDFSVLLVCMAAAAVCVAVAGCIGYFNRGVKLNHESPLIREGKRAFAKSAESLRRIDPRPPILLLRSFSDDEFFFVSPPFLSSFRSGQRIRVECSLEEAVQTYVAHLGPFIAIGKPGEWAPTLGAARQYVKGQAEEWKGEVLRLLSEARFVVIILGSSEGLLWEFSQIANAQFVHKLIVVLPPVGTSEVYRRWNLFREGIGCDNAEVPNEIPPQTTVVTFGEKKFARIYESPGVRGELGSIKVPASHYAGALESILQDRYQRVELPQSSSWALLSFVCGILSPVFCPLGPCAILFGFVALRDMKAKEINSGRWMAFTGMTFGVFGTLCLLLLFVVFLVD